MIPPTFNAKGSNGNILNRLQLKEKVKQIITPSKDKQDQSLSPYRKFSNDKNKSKSNQKSQIQRSIHISGN